MKSNTHHSLDFILSRKKWADFQIIEKSVDCDFIPQDPISCVQLSSNTLNVSSKFWGGAIIPTGTTITEYGINGIDNHTSTLDGDLDIHDKYFFVLPVTGNSYCYETINTDDGIDFCGGFFQGNYFFEDKGYQVLPLWYPNGWTITFDLALSGATCSCTGTTLNDDYENGNIFFYWGARAKNKFCNIDPFYMGINLDNGNSIGDYFFQWDNHVYPDTNPFLFFDKPVDCLLPSSNTINLADCCDNLNLNGLAFLFNEENQIGYRYILQSSNCETTIYKTIEDFSTQSLSTTKRLKVAYRFKPYDNDECKPTITSKGVLEIFVNGKLKLIKKDFPNIAPYGFDKNYFEELGVTYTISIGGGTQGLVESAYAPQSSFTICTYNVCIPTGSTLNKYTIFNNTGGTTTYMPAQPLTEIEDITLFLKNSSPFVKVKSLVDCNGCINHKIELLNNTFTDLDILLPDNNKMPQPTTEDCKQYYSPIKNCDLIEQNFVGNFIGNIKSFCIYDNPLKINQIKEL